MSQLVAELSFPWRLGLPLELARRCETSWENPDQERRLTLLWQQGSNQCLRPQGVGTTEEAGDGMTKVGVPGTHPGVIDLGELRGMGSHQQRVRGALVQLMPIVEPLRLVLMNLVVVLRRLTVQALEQPPVGMEQKQLLIPGSKQHEVVKKSGMGPGVIEITRAGVGHGRSHGSGKMNHGMDLGHGRVRHCQSQTTLIRRVGQVGVIVVNGLWL